MQKLKIDKIYQPVIILNKRKQDIFSQFMIAHRVKNSLIEHFFLSEYIV